MKGPPKGQYAIMGAADSNRKSILETRWAEMALPERMKFGIFLGPFHRVGENPTLAIDRDMELVQWLDYLGYDEAWIGEHHSAGWETISSPEIFMAVAADRTRHIKLGSGVISLPYHHPLMVANRMVQLDHMSHGRVMLGVGPGALPGDAYMMGIPHEVQRERMDEALGIVLRLFTETEPITYKSDWFELNEAMLQLRPYQKPYMPVAVASVQTPAGVALAGKYGAAVLTITVPRDPSSGPSDLKALWDIAEESAAEHGQTVNRDDWRLVLPVHLAETRKEAIEEAPVGVGPLSPGVLRGHQRAKAGVRRPAGKSHRLHGRFRFLDHWHTRRLHRGHQAAGRAERRLRRVPGADH